MKIAILTQVYKPVVNGVVRSIENFSKGLRELGEEVFIITPNYRGYKDKESNVYRWKYSMPLKKGYYLQFPVSKKIGGILKEADIIHTQHPFVSGQIGWIKGHLHQIPLVFTYHTMYEDYSYYFPIIGEEKFFKKGLMKFVLMYCNKCDCIIAPSEHIKKTLIERGVKARIEVVPSGVDLKQFENADGSKIRKKYGLVGMVALYLGRVAKEKNLDFLIDAFDEVFKAKKDVTLLIAGSGDSEEFRKNIKKEFANRVIFAGEIASKDVPLYYAAADIFVSASATETQGLTYVEAQASGLPVVVMSCIGSKDIINNGEDGFIVKTKKGLSKKVIFLLENKKIRAGMGIKAKKNSQKFSIEITSKRLLGVYKSLL